MLYFDANIYMYDDNDKDKDDDNDVDNDNNDDDSFVHRPWNVLCGPLHHP